MNVTAYAKRDGINPATAREKARALRVGTWIEGRRELTEDEWEEVKDVIRPRRGRPRKSLSHGEEG